MLFVFARNVCFKNEMVSISDRKTISDRKSKQKLIVFISENDEIMRRTNFKVVFSRVEYF